MRTYLTMLLFCSALLFSVGCTMMSRVKGVAAYTVQALRPMGDIGWDPGSETTDPWIHQAATEGRGNRPVEKEWDPLGLKKVFMSDKARDIERDMGIE